jgi:hypothetical protein
MAIPNLGKASDVVIMASPSGAGRLRVESLSLVICAPEPRNGFLGLDLPLGDFIRVGNSTIRADEDFTEISALPNGYAAHLPLPESLRLVYTGDPALIRVRLRTSRASAGIGVLNQDGSEFLDRKALVPDGHPRTVYLGVNNIADASAIIVYGGPGPAPTRVQIESITLSL